MKIVLLLFITLTAGAQNGQIGMPHWQYEARERAERAASENAKKAEEQRIKRSAGTNLVRVLDGKAYQVLKSTNWVTFPGPHQRAVFLVQTKDGPAFTVEDYHRGEYYPSHRVVIKNLPGTFKASGEILPDVRVMAVGTSAELGNPCAIYDYGALPKPASSPR